MKRGGGTSDSREELLARAKTGNGKMEHEMSLPNQMPVTGDVPKTSALANATVKWKSRLSLTLPPAENGLVGAGTQGSTSSPSSPKRPEVVITESGPQSDLMGGHNKELTRDPDTLSQNSTWTRQSRPGSMHGSRPGSRNSTSSTGRLASALVAMGTGASLTELPGSGPNAGQHQVSRVNVDNPLLTALPYLPVKVAWMLLIINILFPGVGTIIAAFSYACCGSLQEKNSKDDAFGPFCTNVFVGVSQLFTVSFLLIGWIWSITWGAYMVIFAYEKKRQKDEEKLKMHAKIANAFKAGRVI